MDKDIVEGKIGEVGSYDVEFKDGKLIAKAGIAHEPKPGINLKGDLSVEIGARAIIDAAKKAVPGVWDDAAWELLAAALGVK